MSNVSIKTNVSKETYELVIGLAGFVGEIKSCLADGWQPGTDIPIVMSAAISNLVTAVQGLELIKIEAKEDPAAFSRALSIGLSSMFENLSK